MSRVPRDSQGRRISPSLQFSEITPGAVRVGVIGLILVAVACYFAFTKANPFADPYELKAVVESANALKANSPVRIAGVNVGKVTDVKTLGGNKQLAEVTMEIKDEGLPIRDDAELTIRSRLFLEGNYFVDIHPGTPAGKELKSGSTLPPQQTAFPVQFSQVLTRRSRPTRARTCAASSTSTRRRSTRAAPRASTTRSATGSGASATRR